MDKQPARKRPEKSAQLERQNKYRKFPPGQNFRHAKPPVKPERNSGTHKRVPSEYTGAETKYFQSLVLSRAPITVVLTDGERLRGHVRYHDSNCFSIGLTATGPRFFLRKENVSYISEE